MSSASIGSSGESLGRKNESTVAKIPTEKIATTVASGSGSAGVMRKAIRGFRSFLFPAEELKRENRRIHRALRGHDADYDAE